MIVNDFPKGVKIPWVACDTETHTFVQSKLVSESVKFAWERQIDETSRNPIAEKRNALSVSVWAWQVSDGRHFAILETFDEFFAFMKEHEVEVGWWYNGKFDFAQIDYYILRDGWTQHDPKNKKPVDNQYESLHSEMGQRYSYTFYYTATKTNRHKKQMSTTFVDFCNILGGGLKNVLDSLKVVNFDNKPIRKTQMDYQSETVDDTAIEYMRNDVEGLYHAVRMFNEVVETYTDGVCTLTGSDGKKCITAGGIAKSTLLYYLYHDTPRNNVKRFQKVHPMTVEDDLKYRNYGLYRGGITMVNPKYIGKCIKHPLWRYDVNSMYPAQMAKMPDLVGRPNVVSYHDYTKMSATERDAFVAVYGIYNVEGLQKPNMLPFWYDRLNKTYTDRICEGTDTDHVSMLIFEDELKEMENWYDMKYTVDMVLLFLKGDNTGYKEYVDTFYALKDQAKREHNGVLKAFSKLLLNSSYGKLAENPTKPVTHYVYDSDLGAVRLESDHRATTSEGSLLSVVQGALITSMARVHLMKCTRIICPCPEKDFTYCDTDSIHTLVKCEDTSIIDNHELGKLKAESGEVYLYDEKGNHILDAMGRYVTEESKCDFFSVSKYLAPKTYYEKCADENGTYEFHTKGLNVVSVERVCRDKTDEEVEAIFSNGSKFYTLAGMNVQGGKALVDVCKFLARDTKNKVRVCVFDGGSMIDEMNDRDRAELECLSI